MRTLLCALVALLTLLSPAGRAQTAPAPADPEKPGAFPVGVTAMRLEDGTRTDPLTGKPRVLMTEIWYPATDDSRALPKNRLMDFFGQTDNPEFAVLLKLAFNSDIRAVDQVFENFSVRDARVREGRFPLVLFSHGNGGMRMQNAFWCEHLASHGYIVAAPDHTGNCAATLIDGQMVVFNDTKEARAQAAQDRPKDMSFLIDAMTRLDQGGDSRFRGRIDIEHIGMAGHSFGGFTSVWVADRDPRVDAIVPMAGAAETYTNLQIPALVLLATEDDTLGAERVAAIRKYYEDHQGPCILAEFVNAGHYSFTEMYQLNPAFGDGVGQGKRLASGAPVTYIGRETAFRLSNGYSTAFLGKFLKGIQGYDAYLGVNHAPDEILLKSK